MKKLSLLTFFLSLLPSVAFCSGIFNPGSGSGGGGGSGIPGGTTTQIQINGGGIFVGTATLTMDTTANLLTIGATTTFTSVTTTTWQNVTSIVVGDGALLDLSQNKSSTSISGFRFPVATDCSSTTAVGQACVNSVTHLLYVAGSSPTIQFPSRDTLTPGTTLYPSFLYVGSSAVISGSLTVGSLIIDNTGVNLSTAVFTDLSPGVVHIVAGSSRTVTTKVSLSTEVINNLPTTQIAASTSTNVQAAGILGEFKSSVTAPTPFPSTGNYGDLVQISLSSGAWMVTFLACEQINGASFTNGAVVGISTTSGNSSALLVEGNNEIQLDVAAATADSCGSIPDYLMTFNSSTTVYGKYEQAFSVATPKAAGRISAIRPY